MANYQQSSLVSSDPMGYNYAALVGCLRQQGAVEAIDPSVDNTRILPMQRIITRSQGNTNSSYNERKTCSFLFYQSKTPIIVGIYVTDTMPDLCARNPLDKVAYCQLPATQIFKSIEVKLGQGQVETLYGQAMVNDLVASPWYQYMVEYVFREWLGGYKGPNQEYTGLSDVTTFNYVNSEQNVIKKGFRYKLPIISSLFQTSPETFKFTLTGRSILELVFNPNASKRFYTTSPQFVLKENTGDISVLIEGIMYNDFATFTNNVPALAGDFETPYYLVNTYSDMISKKISYQGDMKIQPKPGPTQSMRVELNNCIFSSGNMFFGKTVAQAAETFLSSLVTAQNQNTSTQTFNVATGLFTNGTNVSDTMTIVGWTAGCTSFTLVVSRTNTVQYRITIKCPIPFDSFGSLYIDPNTFTSQLVMSQSMSQPQIYFFDEFTLNIAPYDSTDTSFVNSTVPTITHGNSIALATGWFTFNRDAITQLNRHAFWGVTHIKRARICDQVLYNFSLSMPVPQINQASSIAYNHQVAISEPNTKNYDLDGLLPFKITELIINKASGTQEIIPQEVLEMYRLDRLPGHEAVESTLRLNFDYKDFVQPYISTRGFVDSMMDDWHEMEFNLENLDLILDGHVISTTQKEMATANAQNAALDIALFQRLHRIVKYKGEQFDYVNTAERIVLTDTIIHDVAEKNGQQRPDVSRSLMDVSGAQGVYIPQQQSRLQSIYNSYRK